MTYIFWNETENKFKSSTKSSFSQFDYYNANYTAVAGDRIAADTSGGPWTLSLPANPQDGDVITITDALSTWADFNLTVNANGKTIGEATSILCDLSGSTLNFTYLSETDEWSII